jgi:hypothetical protein
VRGAGRAVVATRAEAVPVKRRRRVDALLLALLLVVPLPAAADMLYKCVDPAGITSIQMAPCVKGTKQVWARDTAPEPPPTPEQVAAAQARAEAQERERVEAEARWREAEEARRLAAEAAKAAKAAKAENAGDSTTVDPAKPPTAPDPCDEAKAFAAQVRGKPWLGLDPGQMQRLAGWVAQQCGSSPSG